MDLPPFVEESLLAEKNGLFLKKSNVRFFQKQAVFFQPSACASFSGGFRKHVTKLKNKLNLSRFLLSVDKNDVLLHVISNKRT
jgi:hypothetical protein